MRFLFLAIAVTIMASCAFDVDSTNSQSQRDTPTPELASPTPEPTSSPTSITDTPTANAPSLTASPVPETATVELPTLTPVPTPNVAAEPLTPMNVQRAFPNLSFSRMVALAYPNNSSNRLFVVLQPGQIRVFENTTDVENTHTFLDIRQQVRDQGNEEGLLGLAFDPEYTENGYFYVYYTAGSPRRSVISRFSVSDDPNTADSASERIILEIPQPFSNHNGGQILFGPDGYLYIGLGDGGSGGDPQGNGQNSGTLLGSILRIDVSGLDSSGGYSIPPDNPFIGTGSRPEIWAYGLRNPWRYTFDSLTGELWAGDVGQNSIEEVDIIKRGLNYGWNIMEGFSCYRASSCSQNGLEPPVIDYSHNEGCSITGGYVYRGQRLPSLYGAYVYGDYCSGRIWALRFRDQQVTEHLELIDSNLSISSFGEDQSSELYILSFDGGIYTLDPR